MGNQELFTTQEVAQELAISDAGVRQMILRGQAHPARRIGNSWVFTRDEVERLRNRTKYPGGRGKRRPPE